MIRTILVTFIFLVSFSPVGIAQVDSTLDQLRTVVPPSPNASSLGKFGEWPVSLYTGLPDISVPIYTLKGRSLSVPISLSYHPAGIRVGEIASWVGLGWALSAGGVITRTVRGVPDEETYFSDTELFSNKNNFCSSYLNPTTYWSGIGAAANGNVDFEQDTYSLNALGKNYRIYFDADSQAHTMPASNIQITHNFLGTSDQSWTLVLEDGTTLVFGGTAGGQPCYEMTNGANFGTLLKGESYISAWYLKSITAVTGEQINFTYTTSAILQDTHFTQSDVIKFNQETGIYPAYLPMSTRVSQQTVIQLSLNTITSDLGTVYFIPTTQRSDLYGGVALSEIKVYSNLTSSYIYDWLFNYTYSTCASGNAFSAVPVESASYFQCRLKLLSLEQKPTDGSPPLYWNFGYNPTKLPSRFSFAQDYWGFYNGQTNNTSLLPPIPFMPVMSAQGGGPYPWTNVGFLNSVTDNHQPNEQYMQAEILDTITYPTGGKTVFTYEGNSQLANQQLFKDTVVNLNIDNVGGGSGPYVDTLTYNFVLTRPEYVQLSLSSSISQAILNDIPGAKATLRMSDSISNSFATLVSSGDSWFNLYLPGHYTLQLLVNVPDDEFVNNTDVVIASAALEFQVYDGYFNLKQELGGLRVNNITSYDGLSSTPILSKSYVYGSPFVIYPMDTVNAFLTTQQQFLSVGFYQVNSTRNGASKYSLGSIQGGTVGYGQVTTYDGPSGANGYTISTFTCDPATQAGLPASLVFPYPPNDQLEWRNGLLLSETTFTAAGIPVKSTQNTYSFVQQDQLQNIGVGYSTTNLTTCSIAQYSPSACGTSIICYTNTNEEVEHLSSTQIAYDVSNGNSLSTTTNHFYDDPLNMQPIRTISLDSKADTVLTYSRSPLEIAAINSSIPLTGPATAALDTMIARNIVGQPVETERYVSGILAYKALTNYQVQPTGMVLPANVMIENSSYPIETRVNFLEYDNYGNLLEQAKANDVNHNYIYDYSANYPIAEVANGDSTSIAYTSFEANGKGGWTLGTGSVDTTKGITGTKSFVPTAAITKSGLTSANTYVLSYWTTASSPLTVAGTISGYPIQGKSIPLNGSTWTYYEYEITGISTASVSGSGNIDELRLYPVNAQMTTYTYVPLVGMSSKCDVDNRVTYYFYDGLNRLKYIKDQDGNILKTMDYHYMTH